MALGFDKLDALTVFLPLFNTVRVFNMLFVFIIVGIAIAVIGRQLGLEESSIVVVNPRSLDHLPCLVVLERSPSEDHQALQSIVGELSPLLSIIRFHVSKI